MEARLDIPSLESALEEVVRRVIREEHARSQVAASPWLSAKSAAEYLDTTEDSVRACVKRGQLVPHRTATGGLRFTREQLDAFARGEPE